jgi:hypothetical protein
VPPSAAVVQQRAATAENALHSGQFRATLDSGAGTTDSIVVQFDFGDQTSANRLDSMTIEQTGPDKRVTHIIAIGDRWWVRQSDGNWIACGPAEAATWPDTAVCSALNPVQDAVRGQVAMLLPHVNTARDVTLASSASGGAALRWYDTSRDADSTLAVNAETGVPRELRSTVRQTGATLTVDYDIWNVPVAISAPDNR